MSRRFLQRRPALWAAGLLMLALLLSQTLGWWHGIVHGPIHGTQAVQAGSPPALSAGYAPVAPVHGGSAHLAAQFFGGHGNQGGDGGAGDSPQCRLFEQCSHGAALVPLPALTLPLVLSAYVLSIFAGLARARWHAHFQARGPPLVR